MGKVAYFGVTYSGFSPSQGKSFSPYIQMCSFCASSVLCVGFTACIVGSQWASTDIRHKYDIFTDPSLPHSPETWATQTILILVCTHHLLPPTFHLDTLYGLFDNPRWQLINTTVPVGTCFHSCPSVLLSNNNCLQALFFLLGEKVTFSKCVTRSGSLCFSKTFICPLIHQLRLSLYYGPGTIM